MDERDYIAMNKHHHHHGNEVSASVSGSLQDTQEIIEFLQWIFRKIDKGDTPEETVRMLLLNRAKIDNITFDSNVCVTT